VPKRSHREKYFFLGRAKVCWPLLCLCRTFCIFERCLDSNPESCCSMQGRYELSHPSPSLNTHFPGLATHLPKYSHQSPCWLRITPFMFCVGNFANLIIFTSKLEEVAHIWAFTCRLFCGGVSQRGAEIEYVTKR
jgi:hypothetical protein